MPEDADTYEPRDPVQGVLYHVVLEHFETFRAQAASLREGEGLPRFVEREFREFLTCGDVHALVIDGVFAQESGRLRFHTARRLTREDVSEVVALVAHRIERLLQRRGVMASAEENHAADRWAEEAPVLAGLAAASVQGLLALGPRAGARLARGGSPPEAVAAKTRGPCHAHVDGFDLHAGIVVPAGQRERLDDYVVTRCARQSARRGCASTPRGRFGQPCGISGQTVPRICASIRSRSWRAWRC